MEAACDEIRFRRTLTRCRWPRELDGSEVLARLPDAGAVRQDLHQQPSAGGEHGDSEIQCRLLERGAARLVARAHAAQLRRHVGDDGRRRPFEAGDDDVAGVVIEHIASDAFHIRQTEIGNGSEIESDDATARPNQPGSHLRPCTRSATEIDDAVTCLKNAIAALQVEELVRRARSIALGLGARVVGVLAPVHHLPDAHDERAHTPGPSLANGLEVVFVERVLVVTCVTEYLHEVRLCHDPVNRAEDCPFECVSHRMDDVCDDAERMALRVVVLIDRLAARGPGRRDAWRAERSAGGAERD